MKTVEYTRNSCTTCHFASEDYPNDGSSGYLVWRCRKNGKSYMFKPRLNCPIYKRDLITWVLETIFRVKYDKK